MGAQTLYHRTVRLIKQIRNTIVPLFIFMLKSDGTRISFLYAGYDKKLMYYWLHRLFGEEHCRVSRKFILRSRLKDFLVAQKNRIDIMIIESFAFRYPGDHFNYVFELPRWMEMITDTESSINRHGTKEILRRIRKYSLEFEFRFKRSDFDIFYYNMYKPLIKQRHKNSAETADYRYFLDKFLAGNADLLFAFRMGVPVAAQLIEKGQGLYRILAFGISDGSDEIQKMGVHGALYYFAMTHYNSEGHQQMLCGSSMPVALDGVTQFKIRIGAKPYLKDIPARQKYFLIPDGKNSSVTDAMKKNPFFHVTRDGLDLIVFINPEDYTEKEDFLQLYRKIHCENVGMIVLYCSGDYRKITKWCTEEKIMNIRYVRYGLQAG